MRSDRLLRSRLSSDRTRPPFGALRGHARSAPYPAARKCVWTDRRPGKNRSKWPPRGAAWMLLSLPAPRWRGAQDGRDRSRLAVPDPFLRSPGLKTLVLQKTSKDAGDTKDDRGVRYVLMVSGGSMDLTRRRFLTRIGAAGGTALAHEAMIGLGLLAAPAQPTRFELPGRVSNVRVLVLGAGLTGLTVAYELGKAGYDCRVLEGRARPGGRVFTVRRGMVSEEDGPGQTASFDDGLYFNAGPMRISHHHTTTLAYCRELQVPVETFVADTDAAYLYQTRSATVAGRRIRLREARADFDGYIAELLSKALSQAQLELPLTVEDRDRLMAYLRQLGALDRERQYRGSPRRSGYDQRSAPLSLHDLLGGNFNFQLGIDWDSQPTMMQVAGGMDRLPAALASRLGNRIVYGAAVREIRQNERGVWVGYADRDGRQRRVDADYCVSTIPLPVLAGVTKDLSQAVQAAIAASTYDGAGKIGLQFRR